MVVGDNGLSRPVFVSAATLPVCRRLPPFAPRHSIEKFNPAWQNRTGWVLSSEAKQVLAPDMEAELRAAYAPFNRQLFMLLGRTFDW